MKNLVVAGLFALLSVVAVPSGALAAENWCLRNFGDPPGKGCIATAPLQYCLRGLVAGGGVCGRDRSYLDQSDDRPPRPARRAGRDRWDRWD